MRRTTSHFFGAMGLLLTLNLAACAPEKPKMERVKGLDRTSSASETTPQREQQAVATVNDEEISLGEFERRVRDLPEYARVRYRTVEKKQEYLDSIMQFEVMADEAERRDLGDGPEALLAMQDAMVERLLDDRVRRRVSMDDISREDVERYYEANSDAYGQPERRRAAVVATNSKERAERLRERFLAREFESTEARIEAFQTMAAEKSVDPQTARTGGDVGLLTRNDAEDDAPHAQLAQKIFELTNVGDISSVYKNGGTWRFAMLTNLEEPTRRKLDAVARDIRNDIYEKRRRETRRDLLERWRDEVEVSIDMEAVEGVKAPATQGVPASDDVSLRPATD